MRWTIVGVVALVGMLLAVTGAGAHERDPRHTKWEEREAKKMAAGHAFEGSRELAAQGLAEEALGLIDQAVRLDPRVGRFHLTRGFILRDLRRFDEAQEALKEAQRLSTGWILEEASEELAHLAEREVSEPARGETAPPAGPGVAAPAAAAGPGPKVLPSSLYARLGGAKAIEAVVDEFLGRVAANARINFFFAKTDMENLHQRLVEQLGQATGGPEVYKGGPMKAVHEGLKITDSHFDAMVEDLVGTLDKFKVPEKEKQEILGLLGPMRADIVEVKGK